MIKKIKLKKFKEKITLNSIIIILGIFFFITALTLEYFQTKIGKTVYKSEQIPVNNEDSLISRSVSLQKDSSPLRLLVHGNNKNLSFYIRRVDNERTVENIFEGNIIYSKNFINNTYNLGTFHIQHSGEYNVVLGISNINSPQDISLEIKGNSNEIPIDPLYLFIGAVICWSGILARLVYSQKQKRTVHRG